MTQSGHSDVVKVMTSVDFPRQACHRPLQHHRGQCNPGFTNARVVGSALRQARRKREGRQLAMQMGSLLWTSGHSDLVTKEIGTGEGQSTKHGSWTSKLDCLYRKFL